MHLLGDVSQPAMAGCQVFSCWNLGTQIPELRCFPETLWENELEIQVQSWFSSSVNTVQP